MFSNRKVSNKEISYLLLSLVDIRQCNITVFNVTMVYHKYMLPIFVRLKNMNPSTPQLHWHAVKQG